MGTFSAGNHLTRIFVCIYNLWLTVSVLSDIIAVINNCFINYFFASKIHWLMIFCPQFKDTEQDIRYLTIS